MEEHVQPVEPRVNAMSDAVSDDIAALEAKLEQLVTGGQPVEVEESGRRVRYAPGDIAQLRALIAQKKAACSGVARTPARRILF
jgi:hypothetical protein